MTSTLTDPYESLPTEIFLETLSVLQPLQISRSQSVCKAWRDVILSIPALHQVIYLSNQQKPWERLFSRQKLNHDSNLEKITIPLSRQAALSKDRLVDVTLKLQNLRWETQESGETDLDEILSILVPSISTLRNLSISIKEEEERSQPLRFGILRNKEICASLQHLQLDLDSKFCEMNGKDSLSTLLQCGRLKTLIIKDQGPVECEMYEEPDPILSELQLLTILRKNSESLEILEIRNIELEADGSFEEVEGWDQISFSRLKSLELVGLAPSLLSFLSSATLPVLSKLKLSTELSANWREEVELISLELLGKLLESASDCLESIDFELLDAEGGFDTEIWLPKLENLSIRGCYPAMRDAMMEIKCPQLKCWSMYHIADMREVDFTEWTDPSDLFSFLHISNFTLEDICIGDLYFDPSYEEQDRKFLEKHLPFPNLLSLDLTCEVPGYKKPVLKYFPRQETVRERARLRNLEPEESEDE